VEIPPDDQSERPSYEYHCSLCNEKNPRESDLIDTTNCPYLWEITLELNDIRYKLFVFPDEKNDWVGRLLLKGIDQHSMSQMTPAEQEEHMTMVFQERKLIGSFVRVDINREDNTKYPKTTVSTITVIADADRIHARPDLLDRWKIITSNIWRPQAMEQSIRTTADYGAPQSETTYTNLLKHSFQLTDEEKEVNLTL
jgi:hypothetical protein